MKLFAESILVISTHVAPFTGAWIEILRFFGWRLLELCRSLHGSVD